MTEPTPKIPVDVLTKRLSEFQTILQQQLDGQGNNDQIALLEILGSLWTNDQILEPVPQFSVVYHNNLGSQESDQLIDQIADDDGALLTPLEATISGMLTQLEVDFENAELHYPLVAELRVALSKKPDFLADPVCLCTIKTYCKKINGVCKKVMRKCDCSVVIIGNCVSCG